jgi:hypothetical protein
MLFLEEEEVGVDLEVVVEEEVEVEAVVVSVLEVEDLII